MYMNLYFSGEECLGSARIERVGPSHYTMNINNCRDEIKKKREEEQCRRSVKRLHINESES